MMRKYSYIIGASFAVLGIASPALAQDSGTYDGDVIIVTGQKRSENLQDVSVAATVLGGDSLVKLGIDRLDDIQTAVPSLSITDAGLTQSVNIRGVGLASGSPNAANGVATYFDGVFQPPIVSTNSFYDINAVEVFRGPQGTFVGSNSTGGAIFITSRDPEPGELGGTLHGDFGNYGRAYLDGAINLPVGNTLAIRVAAIYRKRDSFYDQLSGYPAPAKLDEHGARIGINWEPSSNFSALVKGEVARKKTGGYAYRPILGTIYENERTDNIYTLDYNTPTRNNEKADQITAKLDYVTDGGLIFRSVSGYQNKRISNFYDTDATSIASSTQDQFVRERVWTQEFNVISPTDGPLDWIVGGYYQKNKILVDISNNPAAPVHVDVDISNRKITTGVFGQVSYELSDQFSVDVGVRYSTYKVDGDGAVQLVTPGGNVFLADPGGHEKDNQFTGKFAVNWKPSSDHLVYAFVAKGYKSGGFASPTTTFKPETVIDYELGWKGTFLDGAVTTQLGAFYYDYKDFQIDVIDATTGRASLINLANAKVKGIEGQIQARLGGFRTSAGIGYTDSSLSGTAFVDSRQVAFDFPGVTNAPQCPTGTPSNPPACLDYAPFIRSTAGGSMLYSPKLTWNLSAEYEFELPDLTITPRISFSHVGSRYTYIAYDPVRDRLPSYNLVNASLGFDNGQFGIAFWATNLTKEKYVTGQNGTGTNEFYGAPREYGVRLSADF